RFRPGLGEHGPHVPAAAAERKFSKSEEVAFAERVRRTEVAGCVQSPALAVGIAGDEAEGKWIDHATGGKRRGLELVTGNGKGDECAAGPAARVSHGKDLDQGIEPALEFGLVTVGGKADPDLLIALPGERIHKVGQPRVPRARPVS